jgi:hypothetical protein
VAGAACAIALLIDIAPLVAIAAASTFKTELPSSVACFISFPFGVLVVIDQMSNVLSPVCDGCKIHSAYCVPSIALR